MYSSDCLVISKCGSLYRSCDLVTHRIISHFKARLNIISKNGSKIFLIRMYDSAFGLLLIRYDTEFIIAYANVKQKSIEQEIQRNGASARRHDT